MLADFGPHINLCQENKTIFKMFTLKFHSCLSEYRHLKTETRQPRNIKTLFYFKAAR